METEEDAREASKPRRDGASRGEAHVRADVASRLLDIPDDLLSEEGVGEVWEMRGRVVNTVREGAGAH